MSFGRPIGEPIVIDEEITETEKFSPRALEMPATQESRWKSLVSAPLKGLAKGAKSLSQFQDPMGQALQAVLPGGEDPFEKIAERVLPTQDKFAERALEKGGELAPLFVTGGSGTLRGLVQAGLAGVGGEVGKEVGGGVGEFFGELAGMGLPSLGKKIVAKEGQQKILDFARNFGLSEAEIAPLIQGEGKQKFLSKFAQKGKRVQDILETAKTAAGKIFNKLRASPAALKQIPIELEEQLIAKIGPIMEELPIDLQKKAQAEFRKVLQKPLTADSLMGLNKKLNYYQRQGGSEIGRLQGPIKETLQALPGTLGEDFKMANQLYKQGATLRKNLKPAKGMTPWKVYKWGKIALGVGLHSWPLLVETMGEVAARKVATKLLTSPRFQNLSKQMVEALNNGKLPIVKNLVEQMQEWISPKKDRRQDKETKRKE